MRPNKLISDDKPLPKSKGRRSIEDGPSVDRPTIIKTALELTASNNLSDLTFAMLAGRLDVSQTMIRYHVGGVSELGPMVLEAFHRAIIQEWPAQEDDWYANLEAVARVMFGHLARHSGIAAFMAGRNLEYIWQNSTDAGREDLLQLLDMLIASLRFSGLPARRVPLYAYLIPQFAVNTAFGLWRQGETDLQTVFADKALKAGRSPMQNLTFSGVGYASMSKQSAFEEGFHLIANGILYDLTHQVPLR